MKIDILQLLDGARSARGLTVVIDVFRAFSVECYALSGGAKTIYAVGDIDQAYALKRLHPDCVLAGERGGAKCPDFDVGNSPSELMKMDIRGKTLIHTTSAGTRGLLADGAARRAINHSNYPAFKAKKD